MAYVPIVPFMHDDEKNTALSLGSAIVDANKNNDTMFEQDDKDDWVWIILPLIIILLPVIVCLFSVFFGGEE